MIVLADGSPNVVVHRGVVVFRKVPTAGGPIADKIKRCDRSCGHVLAVEGNKIVCRNCYAEWKDEGF